jgi:hypothetical protein
VPSVSALTLHVSNKKGLNRQSGYGASKRVSEILLQKVRVDWLLCVSAVATLHVMTQATCTGQRCVWFGCAHCASRYDQWFDGQWILQRR